MSALRTPAEDPQWTGRRFEEPADDPRSPFERDRDRIIHSAAFHRLEHKTQVFVVSEGDFFRTRLTHSLEVAQISRGIARWLGLDQDLCEAIALAHDVGHTPFGHAGEQALNAALKEMDVAEGWNSNTHSLRVVDELENQYFDHPGINLTYATRQGIARHASIFDIPDDRFDAYPQPTLEAQVVNLADMVAYAGHDVEDAIGAGLMTVEMIQTAPEMQPWRQPWEQAAQELRASHPDGHWAGVDVQRVHAQRARRHFINATIRKVHDYSLSQAQAAGLQTHDEVLYEAHPVIALPPQTMERYSGMVRFLFDHIYKHPLIARQNYKEQEVLRYLFQALVQHRRMLPQYIQERIEPLDPDDQQARAKEVAYYLAELTDRGAFDLYAALTDPRDRAMGHHD